MPNDNQIQLSNADMFVWDAISDAINSYFDVIYPGASSPWFFNCDTLEWTHLSEDGIIILMGDSIKKLQVGIEESFESRNDGIIYRNCKKFDKMVNECLDNLKYIVHDLYDIPDSVDDIQSVVSPYL